MEVESSWEGIEGDNSSKRVNVNPSQTSMQAFINRVFEMDDIDLCMIDDSKEPKQDVTGLGNDHRGDTLISQFSI